VACVFIEEVGVYCDGCFEIDKCTFVELSVEFYGKNEHIWVVVGEKILYEFA